MKTLYRHAPKGIPCFARPFLQVGVECLLVGDVNTGKAVQRDYINATIGLEELSPVSDKSSKNLMRMFGSKGTPQANNLFTVIRSRQEQEGIRGGRDFTGCIDVSGKLPATIG